MTFAPKIVITRPVSRPDPDLIAESASDKTSSDLEWPLLRRSLGLALALVAALAMGDLGVIALFGTPHSTTLSLMIYQQLGAYLVVQATVTALLLLMLCLAVFWLLERIIGGKSDA